MDAWPDIPFGRWEATGQSLHMWSQIVGKFRFLLTPWINHSWQAAFYFNARGMTTSLIPGPLDQYEAVFDFVDHRLIVHSTSGQAASMPLESQSVADFFHRFRALLKSIGAPDNFHAAPNEVPDAIPFAQQTNPGTYNPDAAHDFWLAALKVDQVFKKFRTGFLGKVSPVHLFWGSFDIAVTRFSGRTAPLHPGGFPALPDDVTQEAYSHEVSSAGFWPGGGGADFPAFYSYAYPMPEGFRDCSPGPSAAYFDNQLGEFLLPYDAVRTASDPSAVLLEFLQATYAAAAETGNWDRAALEADLGEPRIPRNI